ncbi:MAG: hypothetical protein ABFD18_06890 [Syntrophomonas sp.]
MDSSQPGTQRCNEAGVQNRPPVLLIGGPLKEAGDIFSPRYV